MECYDSWMLDGYAIINNKMEVRSFCSRMRSVRYTFINAIAPHPRLRWSLTAVLALAYAVTSPSVCSDIITYLIAFYLLTIAINYFTPKGVAQEIGIATNEEEEPYSLDDSLNLIYNPNQLPNLTQDRSQDKPLARSLSEQDIWGRTTLAVALGAFCSYFQMLQIDVFWPLLLLYFAGLALYTIFKILKTMDRYRYSLADFKKAAVKPTPDPL